MKVGQLVKVINIGRTFSAYNEWIKENAPEYLGKFKGGFTFKNGTVCRVVAVGKHGSNKSKELCLLQSGENVALMNVEGVEIMEMFQVGQRVKVVNIGKCYDTYKSHPMLSSLKNKFVYTSLPTKDEEYVIVDIGKHESYGGVMFLISKLDNSQVFLIGGGGIAPAQLSVNSTVTVKMNSDAVEFVDGAFKPTNAVVYEPGIGCDIAKYIITAIAGDGKAIIRRNTDKRIFFVSMEFLNEVVVIPKYKRGEMVQFKDKYYRVVSSTVQDGEVTYNVTVYTNTYEGYGAGMTAREEELSEVGR